MILYHFTFLKAFNPLLRTGAIDVFPDGLRPGMPSHLIETVDIFESPVLWLTSDAEGLVDDPGKDTYRLALHLSPTDRKLTPWPAVSEVIGRRELDPRERAWWIYTGRIRPARFRSFDRIEGRKPWWLA